MNSALKSLVKIGAPVLIAVLSSAAFGQSPDYVRIRSVSYAGTGCPAGSVAQNISSDYRALTVLFDSYYAEVGPSLSPSAGRKNCNLLIDLDFPSGWSYTLIDVDYRGFVSLDPGVSAVQSSSYYFQGGRQTGTLSTTMSGPTSRDYQIRDTLGLDATVWSPCGASRALIVNTTVRADNMRNRNGRGLITLDSINAELTHIYGLRWQRCR